METKKDINYKFVAEALIDGLLSDYKSALGDDNSKYKLKLIITRLANLTKYADFPVNEIIRLAHERNDTFSFLKDTSINTEELEELINKQFKEKW